jgi:hypothetical protein
MKWKQLSGTTAIIAGLAVLALSVALRVTASTEGETRETRETRGAVDATAVEARSGDGTPLHDDSVTLRVPPTLPRGIPGAHAITGWSRSGTGAQTRWTIAWKSDAVTAARILGWLAGEGNGISYALTPTPDGGWTVEATVDTPPPPRSISGGGPGRADPADLADAADAADPETVDQLARLLERSSREGAAAETMPAGQFAGGTAPYSGDTVEEVRPLGIAGGGSGFVRIDGGHFSWLHRDEALYLEPVR